MAAFHALSRGARELQSPSLPGLLTLLSLGAGPWVAAAENAGVGVRPTRVRRGFTHAILPVLLGTIVGWLCRAVARRGCRLEPNCPPGGSENSPPQFTPVVSAGPAEAGPEQIAEMA